MSEIIISKPADLIVGLFIQKDKVLCVIDKNGYLFPSVEVEHGIQDKEKKKCLTSYFKDTFGVQVNSLEIVAFLPKDIRGESDYCLDNDLFIFELNISMDKCLLNACHDNKMMFQAIDAIKAESLTLKNSLVLEILKLWKSYDYKALAIKDVFECYNKWRENMYEQYRIKNKPSEKEERNLIIDDVAKQDIIIDEDMNNKYKELLKGANELTDLMSKTVESIQENTPVVEIRQGDPELQITALETIKNHLSNKLYNLNKSHLTEEEKRTAYRLMGHLLKRANDLLDKYAQTGAQTEYDIELKKLVYELESENLSPFEKRV